MVPVLFPPWDQKAQRLHISLDDGKDKKLLKGVKQLLAQVCRYLDVHWEHTRIGPLPVFDYDLCFAPRFAPMKARSFPPWLKPKKKPILDQLGAKQRKVIARRKAEETYWRDLGIEVVMLPCYWSGAQPGAQPNL